MQKHLNTSMMLKYLQCKYGAGTAGTGGVSPAPGVESGPPDVLFGVRVGVGAYTLLNLESESELLKYSGLRSPVRVQYHSEKCLCLLCD